MKHMVRHLVCLAPVAGLMFGAAAKELTSESYVQDGLIAQWDGIENAGRGVTHADAAGEWVNLIDGDNNFTLTAKGSFVSNAFVCAGGGIAAKAANKVSGVVTLEVVCDHCSASWSVPFYNGSTSCFVGMNGNWKGVRCVAGAGVFYSYSTNSHMTVSCVSGAHYVNGLAASSVGNSYFDNNGSDLTVGAQAGGAYGYAGKIYAIRLYNRSLTKRELSRNARIDQIRFFGRTRPSYRVRVVATENAQVSVDDGEFAGEVEQDVSEFDDVDIACRAEEGHRFVCWTVDEGDYWTYGRSACTLNVQNDMTITGRVENAANKPAYSASDYIEDGTLAIWDGLENAALWREHDSSSPVWKDLVGDLDMVVQSRGSFLTNAFKCASGTGYAAVTDSATKNCTSYKTIEIVCTRTSSGCAFDGGNDGHCIIFYNTTGIKNSSGGAYRMTTTNVATYAFTPSDFYENGAGNSNFGGADSWNSWSGALGVGVVSLYPSRYVYTGTIYAIRLYARALSAAEILAHARLDQIRFFGADPGEEDSGDRRFNEDGELEYRVTVTAGAGGAVRVNGGASCRSNETWVVEGGRISVAAEPFPLRHFAGWMNGGGLVLDQNTVTSLTATVTVTSPTQLKAVFLRKRDLRAARAADYVQNGLVIHWDGIENAGHGSPHDAAAAVWKDLAGTNDLPLVEGQGSFVEGRALRCRPGSGSGCAAGPIKPVAWPRTIEFVLDSSAGQCVVFCDGSFPYLFAFSGNRIQCPAGKNAFFYATPAGAFTMDWRSPGEFFAGGCPMVNTKYQEDWSGYGGSLQLGGPTRVAYQYSGRIFAVRLYNRVLTDEEMFLNSTLDRIRYFGLKIPSSGTVLTVR